MCWGAVLIGDSEGHVCSGGKSGGGAHTWLSPDCNLFLWEDITGSVIKR